MSVALPPPWERFFDTPFRELLKEGPTGSLDWRVTLARADAPAPIVEAIRSVVRKTRLWRGEKRAVTEELLAHFQDGLDAGATAEELVERFGDPTVSARLIRRAKVRCRPLGWHAWWWATRGAATAAALYLALGVYLMSRSPRIERGAFWATINGPIHSRPESDKAWPDYARLLTELDPQRGEGPPAAMPVQADGGLMEGLSEYTQRYRVGGREATRRTDEQQERLDAWLTERNEWLAGLRRAALKPSLGLGIGPSDDFPPEAAAVWGYSLPSDDSDIWRGSQHSSLHPQQNLRVFADWLLADAEFARRQGDGERALANLRSAIGLSRQAREPATLLDTLIADRIVELTLNEVTKTLRDTPGIWLPGQLRDLAHALATVERSPEHWLASKEAGYRDFVARLFAGERLSLDGIQTYGRDIDLPDFAVEALRISRPPRKGGETHTPIEYVVFKTQAALVMPAVVVGVTRTAVLHDANRLFRIARERVRTPLWADPPSVQAAIDRLPAKRGEIAECSLSGLDWWPNQGVKTAGAIDGALVGIALELARREADGKWPATLEALAPRYLPELPIDLINGGRLGYRTVGGQPVIYSLGVDRDNDQGRLPAACDPNGTRNLGYSWRGGYRPSQPLNREMTEDSAFWEDGDWVLWSLAEPRYQPDPRAVTE